MKLAITRDQKIFNQFDLSTMCKTDGWITLIPDRKRNIAMLKRHSTNRSILSALVLAVCIVFGGLAGAQSAEPISPKLTSKLQDLLRKEMLAVNDASQEIITAIVTGNDERVATLAQQIHDSFILRQSMTPQDKADLMSAVPKDFVMNDKAFHKIAGELAQAARDKNRPLQQEHFSRMLNACVACHSTYATDRFVGFAQ